MATSPTRNKIRVSKFEFTCESGKVVYPTRSDALDGADTAMMNGYVDVGCHLMPYECASCGHWHVRNHRIVSAR